MGLTEELNTILDRLQPTDATVQRVFETELDDELVARALEENDVSTIRRRRLPAESAVMLVVGMALMRHLSIREVAARMDLVLPGKSREVAPSALTQARERLGSGAVRTLFELTAVRWSERPLADRFHGLPVFAIDGSTLSVADSDANARHFGRHRSGKAGTESAYPIARIVWATDCRTRLLRSAAIAPYQTAELTMAREVIAQVPESSVLLLDRLYHNSPTLVPLLRSEKRNFIVRMKTNARWESIESYGAGDELIEIEVSDEARRSDPSLPRTYRARAVRTRTKKAEYMLLTSLIDPVLYPAEELRQLYRERWEVELAYDELKTDVMRHKPSTRSRTIEGTLQELWATLLLYNLVRLEMAKVARAAKLPPKRISFVLALWLFVDMWNAATDHAHGRLPEHLRTCHERMLRNPLPPRRGDRHYPRVVKRKESPYPRKRSESRDNSPN